MAHFQLNPNPFHSSRHPSSFTLLLLLLLHDFRFQPADLGLSAPAISLHTSSALLRLVRRQFVLLIVTVMSLLPLEVKLTMMHVSGKLLRMMIRRLLRIPSRTSGQTMRVTLLGSKALILLEILVTNIFLSRIMPVGSGSRKFNKTGTFFKIISLSAYYHSGGWRINPNLYKKGKVCLSLLNTWTGRGNEVWDPSSSSLLQVLVSLQGLVLNSKPYFNEAGYDKQIGTAEGEKNSLSYNENAYLLNCKTMMYLMRKPPKDFVDLVVQHFRRRGYYILKACDAYMKGHLIGSLAEDASVSSNSHGKFSWFQAGAG